MIFKLILENDFLLVEHIINRLFRGVFSWGGGVSVCVFFFCSE